MNWKNFLKNTLHLLTIVSSGAAAASLGLGSVAHDFPALLPISVTVGMISTVGHGLIKLLQGLGSGNDGQ